MADETVPPGGDCISIPTLPPETFQRQHFRPPEDFRPETLFRGTGTPSGGAGPDGRGVLRSDGDIGISTRVIPASVIYFSMTTQLHPGLIERRGTLAQAAVTGCEWLSAISAHPKQATCVKLGTTFDIQHSTFV